MVQEKSGKRKGAGRGESPVDGSQAVIGQPLVCLGEMTAAEEAAVSRKWRRMGGFQDPMAAGVDQLTLGLGVASPEQEDEVFALPVEVIDDRIGEPFPTFALV